MQSILYFEPIYKEKIWGGKKLKTFLGRSIPSEKIGESWEVSDYGEDLSVVQNGPLQGKTLREVFSNYKRELFGKHFQNTSEFPLLVKIIDAEDKLSVQVHPDDVYAQTKDPQSAGKKEAWYILEALEGAEIVCGFNRDLDRETYKKEILENKAESSLRKIQVKKGDAFLIEPGTVHAIGAGNLILEVQQSSDSTYRVYDYGRLTEDGKPRPLHLEKALDVLNYQKSENQEFLIPTSIEHEYGKRFIFTANDKFRLEKWTWKGTGIFPSMTKTFSFQIVHVLEGELHFPIENLLFKKSDSFLITSYALEKQTPLESHGEFALMGVGSDWIH